jgi:geranylgeranyl diphosphate synthase type II
MSLHATLAPPKLRCSRTDLSVLRAAIERRLKLLVPAGAEGDSLVEAARYALLAPGKRLRPLLVMLATAELGGDALDGLDAGCAIEMVHAASLILDDLPAMDDAPWRRGQASTHVVFGEDVAILAGITLLSQASATLAETTRLPAETRCRLVSILARAVGSAGLAAGQYRDLRGTGPSDLGGIVDANHLKTGMLFVAAVEMAAAIAGAAPHRLAGMQVFAAHLGQAFQLLDDLMDGIDPAGPAEDAGKATLLALVGEAEVRRRVQRHVAHALDELSPDGQLAHLVRQLFGAALGEAPLVLETAARA